MQPSAWIFVLCGLLSVYSAAEANKRFLVTPPEDRYYRPLLSIDGGGLRLHMTNQVIMTLEENIKKHYLLHPEFLPDDAKQVASTEELEVQLADHFDCISGVSAGSWLALYYTSKGGKGAVGKLFNQTDIIKKYGHLYPGCAKGMEVFFQEFGKIIYPPLICPIPKPTLSLRGFSLNIPGITTGLYPVGGLEKTLKIFYGDTKLSELDTAAAVYAFDVDLRNPVLFVYNTTGGYSAAVPIQSRDTFFLPGGGQEPLGHIGRSSEERYIEIRRQDFYIHDLGRASSAFPEIQDAKTFTDVHDKSLKYECVDGALVAPNPTLNSLSFMLSMDTISEVDRIATLSLGTGAVIGDYALDAKAPLRWLTSFDLFRVIVDGGSEVLQANLHFMFYDQMKVKEDQFLRIQPLTNDTSKYAEALNTITDVYQLDMLKEIGEMVAKDYNDTLKAFVKDFIFGSKEKDLEMKKT